VSRDSDSLGFDVEDRSTSPTRCIEVKGSRDTELMFFLSETELEKAKEIGSRYELQFCGGIDLSMDPSSEYPLLRARGYPTRLEHLSVRLENMEMQPVRWRVISSGRPKTATWIFGYGSLIWDTGGVIPVERRIGALKGWHRTWTWISKGRHGAPTCALEESGEVKGILLRLNERTQAADLEYFRSRERKVTEQTLADFPEPNAVTYFWTMGSNLADHEEFRGLTEEELRAALARRARAVTKPGSDGVLASEYIKRVHSFDPDDPDTTAILRHL
jgi:cation transport regulator ChaC